MIKLYKIIFISTCNEINDILTDSLIIQICKGYILYYPTIIVGLFIKATN